MNVFVVGGGGGEHAIGWKLKQSPKLKNLFFSPGNGGTSLLGQNININNKNHAEVISWVRENNIDLVVIGPDDVLADGLTDSLEKEGIKVFGPTKAAAEIEWSKSFAKQLMLEEGIPTAQFKVFSNIIEAKEYVKNHSYPLVIKADGLAFGKGVIVAKNEDEAMHALDEMMEKKIFGNSGNTIVIEEFLKGEEVSIHAFCDGKNFVLFPASQDHKTIYENGTGPNTGGMGTIAPLPWVTKEQLYEIGERIVRPTLEGLIKRGKKFKGLLYPGLMMTKNGPKVVEFNARFGDPETQSCMRLLETDLLEILLACTEEKLDTIRVKWNDDYTCCVVMASEGYPGKYKKGDVIHGLERINKDGVIFHAGTKKEGESILTNGGRVLNVTTTGETLKDALDKAYQIINSISFDGMQFRRDIGRKSVQ